MNDELMRPRKAPLNRRVDLRAVRPCPSKRNSIYLGRGRTQPDFLSIVRKCGGCTGSQQLIMRPC